MAGSNPVVSFLITAKDAASAVIAKVRSALSGASKENKQYADDTNAGTQSNKNFASSIESVTTKLAALATAYFSLQSVKEALTAILQTGGNFERLGIQIRSLMGGIAEGDAAVKWIKDFAKNTPLELDGVAKAFVKLKAFGLDPMDGTLQSLTDLTAKLGGGQEELEGIVLALGQAWSKQKLQAEDINQLVERGVPVWDLLAKATGRNTAELSKLSQEGALGRDVIRGLIDEIGRSSQGSAAAMMSSWSGLVSNLQDTWSQFLDRIAQSGALDYFKRQIEDVLKTVEQMAASGDLQKTAQSISDFFVGAAASIKDAIGFVRDYAAEFKALAAVLIGSKIADMVSSIGANATLAAAGVGKLSGALGSVANLARAGLYGLLAAEILKIVSAYQEARAIQENTANTQRDLEAKTQALSDRYRALSDQLGITIKSMADLDAAVASGQIRFNEQTGAWEKTTKVMRDFDAEVSAAINNQERIVGAFGKTVSEMTNIGRAADEALAKFREWGGESGRNIDGIAAGLHKLSAYELAELKAAMQQAFDAGINRTDELKKSLSAINTEQVSRAWQTLGEKSSSSLKSAADAAKSAYVTIRDSGTASAAELDRAWQAVTKQILAARDATSAADAAEKQRRANIAALDQIGAGPEEQLAAKRKELTDQTVQYDAAKRRGDYAEAARIAQEKERLAFENAKAETEAARSGEVASYRAYDAKQSYLRAIEDTKQALAQLSEQEQAALDGTQDQSGDIEQKQQGLEKLKSAIEAISQPVALTITDNIDDVLARAEMAAQRISELNSMIQAGGVGAVDDSALQDEVLKRGVRR